LAFISSQPLALTFTLAIIYQPQVNTTCRRSTLLDRNGRLLENMTFYCINIEYNEEQSSFPKTKKKRKEKKRKSKFVAARDYHTQ
jgi:hypothetical protein